MDASPYLSAIQSLNGETPGEKYKDLHSIARKIIDNNDEREKFEKTGETNLVPSVLQPNLHILVGLKLKSKDAIVKALKSDDVSIIKLALGAKWFFNAFNDLMGVHYFMEQLVPFVSLRTRLELIKTLSKCLKTQHAETFYRELIAQFGRDQALTILIACGEDFVYDEILKNKIFLTQRMLNALYRKYPELAIRYLRAINLIKGNKWKKTCNYKLNDALTYYVNFLPNLVKNHTKEFVEFVRRMTDSYTPIQLGSTRAEYFLRNATDALVEYPRDFLDWLPLKLVKSKLSKEQYDTMLLNLLPWDCNQLTTSMIVNDIQTYYPKEGGFELFRENYKEKYECDLLKHKDLFENDCIYKVLPPDTRAEYSRNYVNSLVNSFTDKTKYLTNLYRLPPNEAIPLLKEQVKKPTVVPRDVCLRNMLQSCDLHKSKPDLLKVLQYYNSRHKNEQAQVLLQFLSTLAGSFDNMESLDKEHWQVVKEIIQRAHVKGDFAVVNWYFNVQSLLRSTLRYFLKQCTTGEAEAGDKVFLEKIVNIILEYYCECNQKWDFVVDAPELEEVCLEKFLIAVPQKYPEGHAVWKKDKNKLNLTSFFVEKLGKRNDKNPRSPLDPKVKATKMTIQDYPWLEKFATELFLDKEDTSKAHSEFKKSLRKYCPEFYKNLIDEHSDLIYDVTTNDALIVLRRDRSKISSKINEYVKDCRSQLASGGKCTRHFVMSLKWYQDIPLKFVEQCLAKIDEKGSILILGILLEGSSVRKIVEPYLPKETKLEIDSETAKKDYEVVSSLPRALNYANPPPPLESLIPLCKGDYLSVALQTLSSIAQRVPIDKVLSFANNLPNKAVSVRKACIRLVFQVSPKAKVLGFLTEVCKEEENHGIREIVSKMVYDVFTQTPSQESWQLMKELIRGLLHDDKHTYDVLEQLESVHKDYATDYLLEIFKKIESFSDEELNEVERSELISSFLNQIKDPQIFNKLPENVISEIITKCLFECTLRFIYNIYLFSDEKAFEGRLKVLMGTLSEYVEQANASDPKRPRSYKKLRQIYDVFGDIRVLDYLRDNKNVEMNRRLISSVLENTSARKVLHCFINFNIYQIFFETSKANASFGEKCGKNIDDLVEIYNSQCIIENYGDCLVSITNTAFREKVFEIIKGMMNYKLSYGVFVGLKLIRSCHVSQFDTRCNIVVEAARNSGDLMLQALLNTYLKEISYYIT